MPSGELLGLAVGGRWNHAPKRTGLGAIDNFPRGTAQALYGGRGRKIFFSPSLYFSISVCPSTAGQFAQRSHWSLCFVAKIPWIVSFSGSAHCLRKDMYFQCVLAAVSPPHRRDTNERDCRAERLPLTRCRSNFMRSSSTSAISRARWRRPSRSRIARWSGKRELCRFGIHLENLDSRQREPIEKIGFRIEEIQQR